MIRSIWVVVSVSFLTGFYGIRILLGTWLRSSERSCICERLTRRWAQLVLRVSGVRVVVEGAENVDWSKSVVIVANHQSWYDVFALAAWLPGQGTFVAKEELGRIPIFGPAWKACGHISLDRSNRRKAIESLEAVGVKIRRERRAVILFPEGTRSSDGRLQEFKLGAFVLALKTGVPIVPLGISGSRSVMAKGTFRVNPGEIRLRIGEPIPVEGMGHEHRNQLLEQSRVAIAGLMDEADTRV